MTDTSKFRPDVLKLFEPRPPLRYLDPIDVEPAKRKTPYITGISKYLDQLKDYKETNVENSDSSNATESLQAKEIRLKKSKQLANKAKLDESFANWNPHQDPQIRGDPYRTLFVGRLDYEVTEIDLQQELSKFGDIERIRVVRDKDTNKPRGYAFVLFEEERGARAAYKEGNGLKIKDRQILTDIERGRTIKSWLPGRLGGGLGGRHYTQRRNARESIQSTSRGGRSRGFSGVSRGRGSTRGGYSGRGGRGDFNKSRFNDRYEPRTTVSRGYDDTRRDSRVPRHQPRPEKTDYPSDYISRDGRGTETTPVLEYSSRSRREDRDFKDRERDHDRDSRVQNEREKERERYREQRIENQKSRMRY